jgi:hypothetical protein
MLRESHNCYSKKYTSFFLVSVVHLLGKMRLPVRCFDVRPAGLAAANRLAGDVVAALGLREYTPAGGGGGGALFDEAVFISHSKTLKPPEICSFTIGLCRAYLHRA